MARRIRLALLVVIVVMIGPTDALARASTAEIVLSRQVGPPTSRLTVGGRGYQSGETVDILFDEEFLGATATNPEGSFLFHTRIPKTALPGDHLVMATGESSGLTADRPIAVHSDWPMFQFSPDRNGANPYENVLSPANVAGLALDWTTAAGDTSGPPPVVSNGRVFFGTFDGTLYGVDAETGTLLWTNDLEGNTSTNLAIANGMLYASSLGTYAFDPQTGEQIWSVDSVGGGGLLPVGDVLYSQSGDTLFELDAKTGQTLWSSYVGEYARGGPPAYAQGIVYATTDFDCSLLAFDASTGFLLWGRMMDFETSAAPAVAGGFVVATTTAYEGGGSVYAFDAKTGVQQWRFWDGLTSFPGSPTIAHGRVIVTSSNGDSAHLYSLDARTGVVDWVVPLNGSVGSLTHPVEANGVIYLPDLDSHLSAFDEQTGKLLWEYQGTRTMTPPAVADGALFSGSVDGISAFRLNEGRSK